MNGETNSLVAMDPTDHVMVGAALARLGFNGSWDRLIAGGGVSDLLDRADADLLVAAAILTAHGDRYRLLRDEPPFRDGTTMANGALAYLQRAVQHAEGGSAGWDGQDPDLVLRQGRSSARIAGVLAEWVVRMPAVESALHAGQCRFLDVGVGIGAISSGLCQRYPSLTSVGLDVVPEVLALADQEISAAGLADRIELRQQSVADLTDNREYDFAWLPQPFIPRQPFEAGVRRVFEAVRPDGWVVVPLMTPPALESAFERAVVIHAAHVLGGGPIEVHEAVELLEQAGWVDIAQEDVGVQVCLLARRPALG